jgi:hypothetical protein
MPSFVDVGALVHHEDNCEHGERLTDNIFDMRT